MKKITVIIGTLVIAGMFFLSCTPASYNSGLAAEKQGQWDKAVTYACMAIDKKKGNYPDGKALLERAARSSYDAHLKAAEAYDKEEKYDNAVAEYKSIQNLFAECQKRDVVLQIVNIGERIENSSSGAAEKYYAAGIDLMKKNLHKEAATAFRKVREFKPGYKDADDLYVKEKALAIKRIAVLPFTSQSGGSTVWADKAYDEISSKLFNSKPEFLEFMDRATISQVLAEHRISLSGWSDDSKAIEIGKIASAQLILVGTISNVSAVTSPETQANKQFTYTVCTKYNTEKACIESKNAIGKYILYQKSRSATVMGSVKVVNVETSRVDITKSFTKNQSSTKQWAAITDGPKKEANKVPGDVMALVNNMDREPTSEDELLGYATSDLANEATSQVLDYYK